MSDIYNINKTTLVTSQIYILYYNTMSIHTCCNISNYILAFASFLLHKFYLWIKRIFEIEFYEVKRNMTNAIRWISNICYLQNLLLENIMERRDFYTISFFFLFEKLEIHDGI
jgi:hypothetical protein